MECIAVAGGSTMSQIVMKGFIRHGQVIVAEPIDLPDGAEVTITASAIGPGDQDDDRPRPPEEIAAALAAMHKMEPFVWTDEERTHWEAERRQRKEWEKAHFAEHAEKLRRLWE
jgi:hypothetical protein